MTGQVCGILEMGTYSAVGVAPADLVTIRE